MALVPSVTRLDKSTVSRLEQFLNAPDIPESPTVVRFGRATLVIPVLYANLFYKTFAAIEVIWSDENAQSLQTSSPLWFVSPI